MVIFVFNVKNITKVVCKNSWFGNLKSDGEVDGEVDGEQSGRKYIYYRGFLKSFFL